MSLAGLLGVAGAAGTLVLSVSSPAWAQTDDDRSGARAAASEGLKAFDAKKWADALDLFRRAESLVHAPPHLLYMARANVQLGHLVEAHELYERIRNENITPDKPHAFQQAHADAETELAALEPSIPYVKVVVAGGGSKAVALTVDGAPVNAALIGVARPIDPGEHKLQATAEGLKSDVASVVLKKGETQTVTLELRPSPSTPAPAVVPPTPAPPPAAATPPAPIAPPPAASPPPSPPPPDVSQPAPSPAPPSSGSGSSGARIGSYVSFGVGAVGVGVGVALLVVSHSKESQATDLCTLPNGGCPGKDENQIKSLDSDSKSDRAISIVGFAVGGAAIVTGVALLFVHGGSESGAPHAAAAHRDLGLVVHPWVSLGSAGLSGSF